MTMVFTRTPAGLSNQHLFYNVNFLVFLEGGDKSYSFAEVNQDLAGDRSTDITFWQKIFSKFAGEIKVVFKTVGSKATLIQIAEGITDGSIRNVFVAMDQDLDRFTGRKIETNGVFYTWGYSWENDVLQEEIIVELICMLAPKDRSSIEGQISELVSQNLSDFCLSIRRYVKADILLGIKGKSLFPRKDCNRLIKAHGNHKQAPELQVHELRRLLSRRHISLRALKPFFMSGNEDIVIIRDIFGHLYCTYCYRLLLHFYKRYVSVPAMARANTLAIATAIFAQKISSKRLQDIFQHYDNQFIFLRNYIRY